MENGLAGKFRENFPFFWKEFVKPLKPWNKNAPKKQLNFLF